MQMALPRYDYNSKVQKYAQHRQKRLCRGVIRNLQDIFDGAFFRQWLMVFSCLLFLHKTSTIDD